MSDGPLQLFLTGRGMRGGDGNAPTRALADQPKVLFVFRGQGNEAHDARVEPGERFLGSGATDLAYVLGSTLIRIEVRPFQMGAEYRRAARHAPHCLRILAPGR